MGALRLLLIATLLVAGGPFAGGTPAARAQDLGRIISPILTLDRDKLFSGTLYGQRVNKLLEDASAAMAEETRSIEAALEEEERQLTTQRATLAPETFRELATAFDEKVQKLRADRADAETNLRSQIEAAQTAFFKQVGPVLGQLVRERGAVLIVDHRAILLAAADVDITEDAIARVDSVLGDGADLETGLDTLPDGADPQPQGTPGDGLGGLDMIPAPDSPGDTAPAGGTATEN